MTTSPLLIAAALIATVTIARAADLPVRYTAEEKPLKSAVAGTPLAFGLHSDANCTSLIQSLSVPVEDVTLISRLKQITPKNDSRLPNTVELRTTLTGVDPTTPIYLKVTSTNGSVVPVGGLCQAQSSGVPGPEGPSGEPGAPGTNGQDGSDGLQCWDLDADGQCDLDAPDEDRDDDGSCTVADCQGAQGAPGTNGVSGHVIVTQASGPQPDGGFSANGARAFCPAGKVVVGGGYGPVSFGDNLQIAESHPLGNDKWMVRCFTNCDVIAYAICINAN